MRLTLNAIVVVASDVETFTYDPRVISLRVTAQRLLGDDIEVHAAEA